MKFLFPLIKSIDWLLKFFIKTITLLRIKRPVGFLLILITRIFLAFFHLLYFRMTVHGYSYIPKKGGVLIAANHQSYLDPHLVALSILRTVTFVSKKENFDIPILGPLIELGNAYRINRSGGDNELHFFAELLKQGHILVIFPEGTIPAEEDKLRSDIEPQTGLLKGKTGVIRLALQTHVPIIPLGISGSGRALCPEAIPKGEKFPFPKPTKITMRFGEPIDLSPHYPIPLSRELLRQLTDILMVKISKLVDHTMNFIPFTLPISKETYSFLRKFEESREIKKETKTA